MEIAKPTRSEARWAESVKMAIELARIPPVSCATMKKLDTTVAVQSFFIASLLLLASSAFLAWKSIGVLAGIGVPWASRT